MQSNDELNPYIFFYGTKTDHHVYMWIFIYYKDEMFKSN